MKNTSKEKRKNRVLLSHGSNTILAAVLGAIVTGLFGLAGNLMGNNNEMETGRNTGIVISDSQNIGTVSIDNSHDTNFLEYSDHYTTYDEEKLLLLADTAYIDEDFEKCFEILIKEELQETPIALYNLGFMYLNGLYVEQDYEKADSYFEMSNSIAGERGKLVSAIMKKDYDTIKHTIAFLTSQNDYDTWNYLSYCNYDKSIDDVLENSFNMKENFRYSIENFYRYEYSDDYYKGYNPPTDSFCEKWISQNWCNTNSHTYLVYRKQEIQYLDLINKYIGLEK